MTRKVWRPALNIPGDRRELALQNKFRRVVGKIIKSFSPCTLQSSVLIMFNLFSQEFSSSASPESWKMSSAQWLARIRFPMALPHCSLCLQCLSLLCWESPTWKPDPNDRLCVTFSESLQACYMATAHCTWPYYCPHILSFRSVMLLLCSWTVIALIGMAMYYFYLILKAQHSACQKGQFSIHSQIINK